MLDKKCPVCGKPLTFTTHTYTRHTHFTCECKNCLLSAESSDSEGRAYMYFIENIPVQVFWQNLMEGD